MDQRNPLPGRITHRLNLDSEEQQQRQEQERLEREQYERQKQQKRKRKEQKKRAKQQQEKAAKQQAQRKIQQRRKQVQKYNDPSKLFQPDSDSDVSFTRLKRKIEQMYPRLSKNAKEQSSESEEESQQQQEESESEEDEQSDSENDQSQSGQKKKNKKSNKAPKRKRNDSDDEQPQRRKIKASVKVEPQMSAKDKLVQQVAVRWSYALPEWPPADYDYEGELKKRGYRSVEFAKFKFVDQVVNGLTKVYELDGFRGVYRGKIGLIDVRPKQTCPSLNFFYSKSEEYLHQILKKALEKQVQILGNLQFKQEGQEKLIQDLTRRLKELVR